VAHRKRWTRLISGVALAGAAALAAVGCTSGLPADGAANGQGQETVPAVNGAEAVQAYQQYVAASNAAAGADSVTALLPYTTDVSRVVISTVFQTQRYYDMHVPADSVQTGAPVFFLPASAGYPRWFVADVPTTYHLRTPSGNRPGTPGGIAWADLNGHNVLLFKQASATARWQLASISKLAPGMSLPAFAVDGTGHIPTVSLSDGALRARPDVTGPLQAALVDDGPASPASAVVASGPLTTGIYDNERAGLLGLTAPRGDVLQWGLEGSIYPALALRTADGGALVFYSMYLNTIVQTQGSLAQSRPLTPGSRIGVPAEVVPLLPHGQPAPRVKFEAQQTLSFAAIDPTAGNEKIQVIAIGGGWSYASAS
jgi:hypothetical protein